MHVSVVLLEDFLIVCRTWTSAQNLDSTNHAKKSSGRETAHMEASYRPSLTPNHFPIIVLVSSHHFLLQQASSAFLDMSRPTIIGKIVVSFLTQNFMTHASGISAPN